MRKLTILFALLTLSVGLLAETQTVNYIDANGKQQTAATATVVTNSSSQVTWGTAGQTTWYIVTAPVCLTH